MFETAYQRRSEGFEINDLGLPAARGPAVMEHVGRILRPARAKVLQPLSVEQQLVAVLDHGRAAIGGGVQHQHPHHVQEQLVVAHGRHRGTARHHVRRSRRAWRRRARGHSQRPVSRATFVATIATRSCRTLSNELFPRRRRAQFLKLNLSPGSTTRCLGDSARRSRSTGRTTSSTTSGTAGMTDASGNPH